MGFFNALKRVLSHHARQTPSEEAQRRIRAAWGLDDAGTGAPPGTTAQAGSASAYDRSQWRKRLRKILEELPASQDHWHDLMADAHALQLEDGWIREQQREEFTFLVRRAVSDRVVSEEEHRKLDHARRLMQMSEAEAEQILQAIVSEAESFFGTPVKDEA
jgi:hypothetical protein